MARELGSRAHRHKRVERGVRVTRFYAAIGYDKYSVNEAQGSVDTAPTRSSRYYSIDS
jgi:hypothetical protein